jgi:hypothetical protein
VPAPSENVILPLSVAAERTGVPADELVHVWGVQEMTRILPDGTRETAVLCPQYLLPPPLPIPARVGR